MKWRYIRRFPVVNLSNAKEQYEELGFFHRWIEGYQCPKCNKVTLVDDSIAYSYCPHCGERLDYETNQATSKKVGIDWSEIENAVKVEDVREWISVKDRLPEKKDYVYWHTDDLFYVLCYVKSTGKMYLAFKDGEYWQDRQGNRLRYVTHWMPLPEPPKEERK